MHNTEISKLHLCAGAIDTMKCFYTMSVNERVLVGTYGVLTIQAKDLYGNNHTSGGGGFKVSFINIKASELYSGTPYDNNNGKYMFPFQLVVAGIYQINVTYNGVRVIGQEQIVVLRGMKVERTSLNVGFELWIFLKKILTNEGFELWNFFKKSFN